MPTRSESFESLSDQANSLLAKLRDDPDDWWRVYRRTFQLERQENFRDLWKAALLLLFEEGTELNSVRDARTISLAERCQPHRSPPVPLGHFKKGNRGESKRKSPWKGGSSSRPDQDRAELEFVRRVLHSFRKSALQGHLPSEVELNERVSADHLFQLLNRPTHQYWQSHEQVARKRFTNTCDWILEQKQFRTWKAETEGQYLNKIFWLQGVSGVGKSVLASVVIDSLRAEHRVVAYYYYLKGRTNNIADVSGSILAQLLPKVPEKLHKYIRLDDLKHSSPSNLLQLILLAFEVIKKHLNHRPILVLDGCDMADSSHSLWLGELVALLEQHGFGSFLTSRGAFHQSLPVRVVDLLLPHPSQLKDRRRYAEELMRENAHLPAYELLKREKQLHTQVLENIARQNAPRTFPEIRLYCTMALRQRSKLSLETILQHEGDVEAFASRSLEDLDLVAKSCALWLTQAVRPITVKAVQEALTLSLFMTDGHRVPNSLECSDNHVWRTPRKLLGEAMYPTTASMLESCKDTVWIDEISMTMELSSHRLFPDLDVDKIFGGIFDLAELCIVYLSTPELQQFEMSVQNIDAVKRYCQNHPFLNYAACNWQSLVGQKKISKRHIRDLYYDLATSRALRIRVLMIEQCCASSVDIDNWDNTLQKVKTVSAEQIAINCADSELLAKLLGGGRDLASTDASLQNDILSQRIQDLMRMSMNEPREACFRILYDHWLRTVVFGNVRHHKSKSHEQRVSEWQDYHAWFDDRHGISQFKSPFEYIETGVERNDDLALRSLWVRCPSSMVKNQFASRTLYTAIRRGRLELVDTLLRKSSDPLPYPKVNQDIDYSPLHEAVRIGDNELVRKLVQYGAEVDTLDHEGNTALFPAIDRAAMENSSSNSLMLIKFLLLHGVNMDARSPNHGDMTALYYATNKGLVKVVELLIRHGADATLTANVSRFGNDVSKETFRAAIQLLKQYQRIQHSLSENLPIRRRVSLSAVMQAAGRFLNIHATITRRRLSF